ncbi:hypothetical protein P8452_62148 [Trifolium repens]|nr:hypothetical protein P8452_62148 [Trifolium repens]
MNEGEVVSDINTYSYLVHTFGKLNKLEEIYVLLREMESSNVLLEIYTKCNVVLWLVVELNPWLRSLIINGVKINKILSEDKY